MKTETFKLLFWDVRDSDLPLLEDKTIISRTLSHGTFGQIKELFAAYDKETIRSVFETLKGRAFSERRRDHFAIILS